jgi:pimeloyl-ACP methyl ester carboxylesterase
VHFKFYSIVSSAAALAVAATLVVAPLSASAASPPVAEAAGYGCRPGEQPQFQAGFADLKAQLGDVMGNPTTCQYFGKVGVTYQDTTTGQAYFARDTVPTSFTNGDQFWAETPDGLVQADAPDPLYVPFAPYPPVGPPVTPVASAGKAACQTVNGPRTPDDMLNELAASGWAAPAPVRVNVDNPNLTDVRQALVDAYARTSGGPVTCSDDGDNSASVASTGAPTPATVPSKNGTVVVYIGGLDTPVAQQPWAQLINALGSQPWSVFSYSGGSLDYPAQQTCQPIATSEALLKTQLDAFRPQYAHAILVGHSLGGVLAFEVGSRSDEADFVSKIVTVDAPLGGVDGAQAFLGELGASVVGCQAVGDLHALQNSIDQTNSAAASDLARGQRLFVVTNTQDQYLSLSQQYPFPRYLAVQTRDVDRNDGVSAHSAALRDPSGVAQIAQFITA